MIESLNDYLCDKTHNGLCKIKPRVLLTYLENTNQYKWETNNRQVAFFRPDGWTGVREFS